MSYTNTISALSLQTFNKPYVDGTLLPLQNPEYPTWLHHVGSFIGKTLRHPFEGKWFLAFLALYVLVFSAIFLCKGFKYINLKALTITALFYSVLLVFFENFAIRFGYWGYPNVIYKYLYELPVIKEIPLFVNHFGVSPLSSPLFVYPLAFFAAVGILGSLIPFFIKNNQIDLTSVTPIHFSKTLFFQIVKSKLFLFSLFAFSFMATAFLVDWRGAKTEIGYAWALSLLTFFWLILFSIEHILRKQFYEKVEKLYYRIFIKVNIITTIIGSIVEAKGLYLFLIWLINPEKTLLYALSKNFPNSLFNDLYKFFGLSAPEEFYYYIICTLLGLTTYNILHMFFTGRDLFYSYLKK